MKTFVTISLMLAGLAGTGTALAADHGDRVERRLDHRGDVIETRYDQRAILAAMLDRAGERYDHRWDRRH